MQLIKYFFEEPAALEGFEPDTAASSVDPFPKTAFPEAWLHRPPYYRGYLTGTNLAAGTFGLTTLTPATRFTTPLIATQSGCVWMGLDPEGPPRTLTVDAVAALLAHPGDLRLLAGIREPVAPETLRAAGDRERRLALPGLRALLDAGAVVLYPEPAHHGFDWSLFSAQPLQPALSQALQCQRGPTLRIFVIPFVQARSEEKFYFETYDLERYRAYEL